jgi:hypothetical protein
MIGYTRDEDIAGHLIAEDLLSETSEGFFQLTSAGRLKLVRGSPTLGVPSMAAWNANLYLSVSSIATNGTGLSMTRWDGAVATALGTAWVDDYAAPTGGNMPVGRYLTAWSERMWVGCTLPSGGAMEPGRICWSHPGRPEDWAQTDYIDVGQQGDVITGIAPMRDMLIVFNTIKTVIMRRGSA